MRLPVRGALALLCTCLACGSAATPAPASSSVAAAAPAGDSIVNAPDRDPKDRELDASRHPAELLAFAKIAPGMHIGELFSGAGYTTELLARAVGPTGIVYGENNKYAIDNFFGKPWAERLAKPVMRNVVRADRELEDPFPAAANNLDAVFVVFNYHDTVGLKTDRDKMNHAVYAALKSGGEYVVVDHAGKDGSGITEAATLHRIEKAAVIADITKAGFTLSKEGDFLNSEPKPAFVLAFVKP